MLSSARAAPVAAAGGGSARPAAAAARQRRPERGRRRQHPAAAVSNQVQQLGSDQRVIEELEAALPSTADETMPAAAGGQRPAVSGGALSLVAPGGQEQAVPTTLPEALATFFTHPSAALIVCALAGLVCWRAQLPMERPGADAAVFGAVAAGWCVQVRAGFGLVAGLVEEAGQIVKRCWY